MQPHLHPQDVVVALKILLHPELTIQQLAGSLGLCHSAIQRSVVRATPSGLLRGNRLPVHCAIREFVLHGLRYSDVTQALTILRTAIRELLDKVLALQDAEDVVAAHLLPDAKRQERLPLVLDRIRGLITAATG